MNSPRNAHYCETRLERGYYHCLRVKPRKVTAALTGYDLGTDAAEFAQERVFARVENHPLGITDLCRTISLKTLNEINHHET
jgi:hypothetical protein